MITRKTVIVAMLALLLMVNLSACMMSDMMHEGPDVEVSVEAAKEAQELLAGAGSVELNESHVSSWLTLALQQSESEIPVKSVIAEFEPDLIHIQVHLSEAMGGIDSVGLSGNVMVDENHMVMVDLDSAYAGPFVIEDSLISFISDRINLALNDPTLGVAVDVTVGDGTLMIDVGDMMMMDGG